MHRSVIRRHWLLASAGVVTGIAAWVAAGPLNPPSGAVASTYKTLSEVEPRTVLNATNTPGDATSVYRIVAPGSYCLDQNLACVSGKHGIKIESDDVTLDLRGFSIIGVAGANDGISVPAVRNRITIRNGTVRSCSGAGISAGNVSVGVYQDLLLSNNTLDGLRAGDCSVIERVSAISSRGGIVTGALSRVASCTARNNLETGIDAGADSLISGCVARFNAGAGFHSGDSTSLQRCIAEANAVHGFNLSSLRCSASECTATNNDGYGFFGGQGSQFTSCRASLNSQGGINTGAYSSARSCDLVQNFKTGLQAGNFAEILDCNSSFNAYHGISVADGCNVRRCNASSNTVVGIIAVVGCTIADCHARFNTLGGIAVTTSCLVLNNCCDFNGEAGSSLGGIRLEATGNRIEGNSLTGNDYNVYCSLASTQNNLIIRNTSRAPTQGHFQIVPGNSFGPVVNVAGAGDISGTANSAHPTANFVY